MKKTILFCILSYITLIGQAQTPGGCPFIDPPFFTDFEDGLLDCWFMIDGNDDNLWWHIDETQSTIACSEPGDKVVSINYNFSQQMDDWLFGRGMNLQAGITYTFSFEYGNDGSTTNVENLAVYLSSNTSIGAADEIPLFANNGISDGCSFFQTTTTVGSDGVYYLAFHGISDANQNLLMIDDVYFGIGTVTVDENQLAPPNPNIYMDETILCIDQISKEFSQGHITIMSALGNEVFKSEGMLKLGENRLVLPSLYSGVYLVIIRKDSRVFVEKIVMR